MITLQQQRRVRASVDVRLKPRGVGTASDGRQNGGREGGREGVQDGRKRSRTWADCKSFFG